MKTRGEIIATSAEMRMTLALDALRLAAFGPPVAAEPDPLLAYADPGPPEDVRIPIYRRRNWARRLLGR